MRGRCLRRGEAAARSSYLPGWSPTPFFGGRSDCLIKTIRSEGYFGMYRGEACVGEAGDGVAAFCSPSGVLR